MQMTTSKKGKKKHKNLSYRVYSCEMGLIKTFFLEKSNEKHLKEGKRVHYQE